MESMLYIVGGGGGEGGGGGANHPYLQEINSFTKFDDANHPSSQSQVRRISVFIILC